MQDFLSFLTLFSLFSDSAFLSYHPTQNYLTHSVVIELFLDKLLNASLIHPNTSLHGFNTDRIS